MTSRIASRVARRFLRLVRTASETPLHSSGTVQIKNLAAKYDIKKFDGRLSDCKFRVWFDILGGQFTLAGSIKYGKMALTDVQGSGVSSLESFPSVARKYFKVDPELWVKRALENALIRSVGPGDLSKWVVLDGEIMDSSQLDSEMPAAVPQALPKAV